jgi:hypothetical protein
MLRALHILRMYSFNHQLVLTNFGNRAIYISINQRRRETPLTHGLIHSYI